MLKIDNISVKREKITALGNVSLSVDQGKTLGIVGESGAGKSTLIAAILGLIKISYGQITWCGEPLSKYYPSLVMQEPRSAFNPSLNLMRSVMEPIIGRKKKLQSDRLARLCDGLELPIEILQRRPLEVSIGQAQRVGILRALIASPPLILFDEPLSALDAITQKHTARLIAQLQKEEGFAALIVTHDLGYAAAYADDIAVLKQGCIEEYAPARNFIENPQTLYGRILRDAAFTLGALEKAS